MTDGASNKTPGLLKFGESIHSQNEMKVSEGGHNQNLTHLMQQSPLFRDGTDEIDAFLFEDKNIASDGVPKLGSD